MARDITVTPEQLRNAATTIKSLAADYKTQYDALYKETSALGTTWSGKDNVAYINQIDGYKKHFTFMYDCMNSYAAFLLKTAQSYEETQNAVVTEAKKLVN